MRKPAFVEVVWDDATLYSDDYSIEEAKQKCGLRERHTSGYIIDDTEQVLRVAGTVDMKEDPAGCSGIWVIPRPWVKKIVRRRRRKEKPNEDMGQSVAGMDEKPEAGVHKGRSVGGSKCAPVPGCGSGSPSGG